MKYYRGPSSKPTSDPSHDHVSSIPSEQLEEMIGSSAQVRFNVSKEAAEERHAVCTVEFEEEDLIPTINGLLRRLRSYQDTLDRVRHAFEDAHWTDRERVEAIKAVLYPNFR